MNCRNNCSGELYLDTRQFKAHLDNTISLIYYCGECKNVAYIKYKPTGDVVWTNPHHGHNKNSEP